jgi:hypothetical protein
MTEKKYKDGFTADGLLKPGGHVTKAKVSKVKSLMESALRGDRVASATLTETITTSDALFNAAYLTTLQILPQFEELPRTWSQIAGVRVLPDFRPAVLRGVFGEFVGLERQGITDLNNPEGIAPIVPENSPYPYATVANVESAYGRLAKRGFGVSWTFEAQVNDNAADFFASIPGEMIQTILDSEEWEVYQALINGTTASQQLDGGVVYNGDTVLPNAPLSRNAIVRALEELALRQVNGRYVGRSSNGYNLIVGIGQGPAANFILNQQIIEAQDGSFTLSVTDQAGLGSITVIESPYVSAPNWYILPKPGGVRRPVLELGRLRGHEAPQLRVKTNATPFAGSSALAPFASFEFDDISMEIRMPMAGLNWFPDFIIWSNGTGVA